MSQNDAVLLVVLTVALNLVLLLFVSGLIGSRIKELQKEITWLYKEVRSNKFKAKVFEQALKGLGVKIVWNIEEEEQNNDS